MYTSKDQDKKNYEPYAWRLYQTTLTELENTRRRKLSTTGPSTASPIKSHIANVIIIIVIINRLWAFIIINRITDFRGANRSYDR